ncbi:MAG: response regulator transcription factor [Anaerolineaceae bacterium]|nr:MAG: response regulator transcription factor [Anaerolineaceae bacterium]
MTIKVLTVDDEPDVRRLIEVKLKKAGFVVVTAVDGEEGVEKAKSENPDLILMDVMMPKMDGYTAVEKIKTEMDPAPLVMMLTAKGTEDDVMQGLMGGADDYITKPFAPRELIARVKVTLIKAGRKADLPPE